MKLIKNLSKNRIMQAGSLYLIGDVFNKAITFLTIPIFTRLLSTNDYGIVNTYNSWVSILSVIIGLSLGSSIRNAYVDYKNDIDNYIASIFLLSLLNFGFSSLILICITYFYFEQIDILLVLFCLIQSFMTFIINSITVKYMMSFAYIKRTLLLALPNIFVVFISIFCIKNLTQKKYYGKILPYVVVFSIIGLYYLIYTFKKSKTINIKYWNYAISLSFPLIFHGLSNNILSNSDRTIITIYQGASETGIYSLIYNFSMVTTAVTSSMESVWIPWFTRMMNIGDKKIINRNVKLYIEIVVAFILIMLLISPDILIIISTEEYWSGKKLIPPIILSSFIVFLYSISVDVEYYYKSSKMIALNTFVAAFVNLILNLLFVPRFGSMAATFTTVIAYTISFVIHYITAKRLDKDLFPFKLYIKPIVIVLLSVILSYFLFDYSLLRWGIVILGFGTYFIISLKYNRFLKFNSEV